MNSLASATLVSNKTKIEEAEKLVPNQVKYRVSAKTKKTKLLKNKAKIVFRNLKGFTRKPRLSNTNAKK